MLRKTHICFVTSMLLLLSLLFACGLSFTSQRSFVASVYLFQPTKSYGYLLWRSLS